MKFCIELTLYQYKLILCIYLHYYRRKVGAFRRADPTSPAMDKGYRLRDTDDRLVRMKYEAQKHRSDFVHVNGVVGTSGEYRVFDKGFYSNLIGRSVKFGYLKSLDVYACIWYK